MRLRKYTMVLLIFALGIIETKVYASDPPVVSIVTSQVPKAKDLGMKDIRIMLKSAIEQAGGLSSLIKDGNTVVIKPNLVAIRDINDRLLAKQVNGVTTDWRIVKVLAEMIRKINPKGKILLMEGSAQTKTEETMKYYNYTRRSMPEIDEFIGLENSSGAWRNPDSPELIKVSLPNGLLRKEYYLNRRYKEADIVISVPVLKTHWDAIVTGAIKNLAVGASPPSMYSESEGSAYHGNAIDHSRPMIGKWIHDFYLCRPADFAIIDGLQGLQNGPLPSSTKDQMNMRLILASKEPIALDGVAAKVMMIDPESVPYLHELAKSKSLNFADIVVKGETIENVKKPFAVKGPSK